MLEEAEQGYRCEPGLSPALALGAVAPGWDPELTRGSTEQAVTQCPQHHWPVRLSPVPSAQHQTPPDPGVRRPPKQRTLSHSGCPAAQQGCWALLWTA